MISMFLLMALFLSGVGGILFSYAGDLSRAYVHWLLGVLPQ